ncbi:MAG: peptidyl-prolyl cis-trans isomerase, partial [Candidatus Roizmanbacteria bacterium]|nr:peptidyl-prolyl cis-trans isomerase [Candidatus Roizmanbacteria bacterium]
MKRVFFVFVLIVFLFGTLGVLFVTDGSASDQKLPVIDGKEIVAMVNDEPITLEEFNKALASIHEEMTEEKKIGSIDYSGILSRLINIRLILQEARNIGIDELPEIKNMVDEYSRETLVKLLKRHYVKDIKVDEKEVEALYKEAVREWKIKSVLFEKEDEAKRIEEEIKKGDNFDDIVKKLLADGTAKGGEEGKYLKATDILPQVAEVISKMEIGSISPVTKVEQGFTISRLEDVRFPENPEAREQA